MSLKQYLLTLLFLLSSIGGSSILFGQNLEQKLTLQLKEYNLDFQEMMRYRGMKFYSDEPSLDNLFRVLEDFDNQTGILFYHYKADTLHAWLLDKGGAENLSYGYQKCGETELAELESDFRALIQNGYTGEKRGAVAENLTSSGREASFIMKELNCTLFPDEIRPGLKKLNKLLVVPALNISTIPLYLLDPFAPGKLLIEDYTISLVHGLQHLFDMNWKKNAYRRLDKLQFDLIGFSTFTKCSGFNDLPGVETELSAAKIHLESEKDRINSAVRSGGYINFIRSGVNFHVNDSAVKTLIEGVASSKRVDRVLYVATHASSNPGNPLDSNYLVTNNCEKITERELQNMDHSDVLLAILSACQTGQGKAMNTGTLSVGRAFLKGNAQNVISSLWSVDDAATAQFMQLFMTELTNFRPEDMKQFDSNEVGFDAVFYPSYQLRKAMLEFRKQDPDPNHWAAFVCTGSPVIGFLVEY